MGTGYTNTKRKRVNAGKKSIAKKAVTLLIALSSTLVILAAILTVFTYIQTENDSGISEATPYGTLEDLSVIEVFLQKYLLVNCNEEVMQTTRTVRVSGIQMANDEGNEFTLTRRLPDLMRLKIDRKTHIVTIGVNGDTVWQLIRIPNKKDEVSNLEGKEAEVWHEQTRFYDTIISTTLGIGSIESITATQHQAKDYLEVSVLNPKGKQLKVLVDPQTMYPYAEIQTLDTGEIQTTKSSDYRNIDGIPIPFRIDISRNETLASQIVVKTAEINTGILSDYFEAPR